MHGLLIAEKPSVMRAVEAIYKKEASKLPFTLDFAAFHGHLMQLQEPEDYDPSWKSWQNLPVVPAEFRYKASDKKSVDLLTAKIKAGNYDFLVNACDAGREGEHIFYSFYETQGLRLPVKRFWVSSVTAPALKKGLSDLRDSKDYNGLRQSAKLRAQLDWLVGMNFTRAATNRKGEITSIGRVQTPVLKLIVDRELQIRNFKPEDFYELKGKFKVNGEEFTAVHMIAPDLKETRFKQKSDANAVEASAKSKTPGMIAEATNEVKSVSAPTLYSLTELQKAANRYLKFKPDKTLAIAQKLYEGGLLTYPRTESRFLPTDMIPEIPTHIKPLVSVPDLAAVASGIGQADIDRMLKGKYVDDAGITDHHAIIPTDQVPNWSALSKEEQDVYTLVGKAFLAIFLPPYQSAVSTILVDVGGHIFKANGSVETDPGYTVLYPKKAKKGGKLPACKKGDKADLIKTSVTKGTTKPPDRYNPETILSAMKNAGQDLPDSAMRSTLREAEGLGTPATRADILAKLETREYVKIEKNAYYALDKGMHLIEDVGDRPFSSVALTAEWEGKLQAIEKGKYSGNFRAEMENFVTSETSYLLSSIKSTYGQVIGKCPLCGADVVDVGKGYICKNRKKDDPNACMFWVTKTVVGCDLTEKDIQDLLSGNATEIKHFVHNGRKFDASLIPDKEKGTKFLFAETVVGTCPLCGGEVVDVGKGYTCKNRKKDDPNACTFWVSKEMSGYKLTEKDIQDLLSGKATEVRHFVNRGKEWDAALIANKEKGVVYYFPERNQEERKTIGTCPFCGGDVVETAKVYICKNRKKDDPNACTFWVSKVIAGYKLTGRDVEDILSGKATEVRHFVNNGKKWDAALIADKKKGVVYHFPERKQEERKTIGSCPLCGKPVIAAENNFYCSAGSDKCKWTFPRVIKGTPLKDEDVAILLDGKRTRMMTFTWNSGKKGKAALYLSNGELKWAFDN